MDLILLWAIAGCWVVLAWHIRTTGQIYRAQADQTDFLIKLMGKDKIDSLHSSPKCEEE
jgi:hypothetical protein